MTTLHYNIYMEDLAVYTIHLNNKELFMIIIWITAI
jgi:hypothetical protein